MAKSEGFPHDIYRFLIRSIRDRDESGVLERLLGGPQAEFERTQAKIQTLRWLRDPDLCPAGQIDYLLALVGWNGAPGQEFVSLLSVAQKRKLVRLSAGLWKAKGRASNIVNAIRVFTGKSSTVSTWFDLRSTIGESRLGTDGSAADSFLVGGIVSDADERVFFVTISRDGLDSVGYQFLRGIVDILRPANERVVLIFPSFFDLFESEGPPLRWSTLVGTPAVDASRRLRLAVKDSLEAIVSPAELLTWKDNLTVAFTMNLEEKITLSEDGVEVRIAGEGGASVTFGVNYGRASGEGKLVLAILVKPRSGYAGTKSGAKSLSFVEAFGTNDARLRVRLQIEAIDQTTTRFAIQLGHDSLELVCGGVFAMWDFTGLRVSRVGAASVSIFIDNFAVFAPPYLPLAVGKDVGEAFPAGYLERGTSKGTGGGNVARDLYTAPPVHVIYDSAVARDFDTLTVTPSSHISPWFAPWGDAIWWSNDGTGSGFGAGAINPTGAFTYQKDVDDVSAWPDADWAENASAPAVKRASSTRPGEGAIVLAGGVTGFPSATPRFLELNPSFTGPCWVFATVVQGNAETSGGYQLTSEAGARLQIQIDTGSGFTTVREQWPKAERAFDAYGFKNTVHAIYVDHVGSFNVRFLQEDYTSTVTTWGIGPVGYRAVDPDVGAGAPATIYDTFAPNYIGLSEANVNLNTGAGYPWDLEDFIDSAATIDGRSELVMEVWFHHPQTTPEVDGVDEPSADEYVSLVYTSQFGGDVLRAGVDGVLVPELAVDVHDFIGTSPPFDFGAARINTSGFWQCARFVLPPSEWQGDTPALKMVLKFNSNQSSVGPYTETDFGLAVARVRLYARRITS